jgi:hypothetical protein
MHAHVTHNQFCTTQKQFAAAILQFLHETAPMEWLDFRSKVTDKFRIISHQKCWVLA